MKNQELKFAEAEALINKYKKKIIYHNKKYYDEDSPEISDFEYDELLKNLETLEKDFPKLATADSPTKRIGGTYSKKFSSVEHKIKMESLHNSYSEEEIINFTDKIKKIIPNTQFIVEPKIDGLSVSIEYKNGILTCASTRGDGVTGENITENILTIKTLPQKLPEKLPYLEIRGEVFMPHESFLELQEKQRQKNLKLFKNPRNAAAGSLRQKDKKIAAERNLQIFVFNIQQIVWDKYDDPSIETHKAALDYLKTLGIPVTPIYNLVKTPEEVLNEIKNIEKLRFKLPFQIDGAVIKVNSLEHRNLLGSTAKFPRWAEAFKYLPEEKETKLLKIEVTVGRTGVLTPIGIFEPILLSGTTVSKATLHNEDFIKEKDIRINDTVILKKSGEIIPEVIRIVRHENNSALFKFPENCPSCGSKVVKMDNESAIRCISPKCSMQLLRNLIHFSSKNAMNIVGLGETLTKKFVNAGLITTAADLYALKLDDLLKLNRFAKKNSLNLLKSIENSKKNNLERLIFAFGIKNVGQKASLILAQKFGNIDSLIQTKTDDLINVDEIGPVIAESVVKYFLLPQTAEFIKKLKNFGVNMTYFENNSKKIKFLNGKTFVLTGSLKNFSREKIEKIIKEYGGKVTSSVSKNTNFVVFGKSPGSKLKKAQAIGVQIINEAEFENLLNL